MHHVELLWDEATDHAVRAAWDRLVEAALPSLARHRSSSNAPHTTLTTTEEWPDDVDLGAALGSLPLEVALGPLTCFGRGPFVLVRTLVVTADLLAMHARVHEALGEPARPFLAPGAWVPHVTLASRLDAGQVARALEVLGAETSPRSSAPPGQVGGRLTGARHWDSRARTLQRLAGPPRAAAGDG